MSPESTAVCMGMDALRILTGKKPKNFTAATLAAVFARVAEQEAKP